MIPRRVLVIDDEIDIWTLCKTSLKVAAGWEVITARTGREGLARAHEEHPDVILLDMMMPEMSGLGVVQLLRASPATRDIPVIIITAHPRGSEPGWFKDRGVQAVIAKPFQPTRLAAMVAAALGWEPPPSPEQPPSDAV